MDYRNEYREDSLDSELGGALVGALEGCVNGILHSFIIPTSVRRSIQEYRSRHNVPQEIQQLNEEILGRYHDIASRVTQHSIETIALGLAIWDITNGGSIIYGSVVLGPNVVDLIFEGARLIKNYAQNRQTAEAAQRQPAD